MGRAAESRRGADPVSVDRSALTLLGVGLGGGALLVAMPPGEGALYPPCPFLAITGMDCPFCGGLRGTYALIHGDIAAAFDHNVMVPFLALAFAVGGLWWVAQRLRGPVVVAWSAGVRRAVFVSAAAALTVFWVVRNLPAFPYLDSGLS